MGRLVGMRKFQVNFPFGWNDRRGGGSQADTPRLLCEALKRRLRLWTTAAQQRGATENVRAPVLSWKVMFVRHDSDNHVIDGGKVREERLPESCEPPTPVA